MIVLFDSMKHLSIFFLFFLLFVLQEIHFTELELPDSSSDEEYNPEEEEVIDKSAFICTICNKCVDV